MFYLSDLFLSKPFERNKNTIPFYSYLLQSVFSKVRDIPILNYSMVIRSSIFNIDTILLPKLPYRLFSVFVSWPRNVRYRIFPFCNTGSRLGLGIAFSCVSLTSCDQKCFQSLSFFLFFFYNFEISEEYSSPPHTLLKKIERWLLWCSFVIRFRLCILSQNWYVLPRITSGGMGRPSVPL